MGKKLKARLNNPSLLNSGFEFNAGRNAHHKHGKRLEVTRSPLP
jgi:hypothetical protein